ncbi:hypothetical protein PVK06_043132 [Gossypium arboreum]|uniref:EF-hand domain-containing protein n=1 Tax=Gossypium arboreum TaxID=29729 RepID=A0ABR0MMQ4_GOSAR|nr:hypothetical protein PVK06_043132 [Gossypium arboreum]
MAIMRCIDVQPSNEMTVDEFKAWLRRFDADHDGRINQEELKEALHSLRVKFGWWKARQGMKEADCNHDGQIENAKEIEKLIYSQGNIRVPNYLLDICGPMHSHYEVEEQESKERDDNEDEEAEEVGEETDSQEEDED